MKKRFIEDKIMDVMLIILTPCLIYITLLIINSLHPAHRDPFVYAVVAFVFHHPYRVAIAITGLLVGFICNTIAEYREIKDK